MVMLQDLHILRQWDITQQVVINDDLRYMRYLVAQFPDAMKEYLIAFFNLFLRAISDYPEIKIVGKCGEMTETDA